MTLCKGVHLGELPTEAICSTQLLDVPFLICQHDSGSFLPLGCWLYLWFKTFLALHNSPERREAVG